MSKRPPHPSPSLRAVGVHNIYAPCATMGVEEQRALGGGGGSEPVYILKVREIQGILGTRVVPRGGGKGESVCVGSSVLFACYCTR
jgi:hypothetical protein